MSTTDLKPENVLISIDNVEEIIDSELRAQTVNAAAAPPTRLVGVPPSKGRGGNQTPRSESVFITGSQPLPSPSSSYGSSSHLDRWAFGMSKIDGEAASKPGSFDAAPEMKKRASGSKDDSAGPRSDSMEQAAERISNVKLEGSPFGEKLAPGKAKAAGPSLLSQQAHAHGSRQQPEASNPPPYSEDSSDPPPPDAPISSSAMSVDAQLPLLDGTEKITVKIADLGNGAWPWVSLPGGRGADELPLQRRGSSTTLRTTSRRGSTGVRR